MQIIHEQHSKIKDQLLDIFKEKFGNANGVCVVCAPGRVNLIGEHTDYNNGFVLPTTINRAVYMALRASTKKESIVHSINFDQTVRFLTDDEWEIPSSHWSSYIRGIMRELFKKGVIDQKSNIEAVIYGDVPNGSGLSSSAALEICFAFGLQNIFYFELDPIAMIKLAQSIEHNYVGVNAGLWISL